MPTTGVTEPKFSDFIIAKLGPKYVIARRSKGIIARYGEDVVCISPQRHKAIEMEYRALHGDPYDPVRAEMYCTLVAAEKHLTETANGDEATLELASRMRAVIDRERRQV